MTRDMMALRGLLRKSGDPDLPRAMIGFAAGRLMALKVGADTGAAPGEKSPTRRRGLRGVKLAISDAQEGIKAAVTPVPGTTWQRCRVHFMRNALAHAGNSGRRVVATAFARDTAETARARRRTVADQLRSRLPKLAALMDSAEEDVLACMSIPPAHGTKLHYSTNPPTNPLERLNGEIKRRTEAVGIFPEPSITRLVGALPLEQNDEWAVLRSRDITLETIATIRDDDPVSLSTIAS